MNQMNDAGQCFGGTGLAAGVYTQDADVLNGVPVFPGTRVPVRILQNWLEDNVPLDRFLDQYSSVTREMAVNFMEHAFNQALGPRDEENHLR